MSSSLSRYRPAVLTIVTLSVGCSLWYAYTAYKAKPSASLHRSNAVHRRQNPVRGTQGASARNDESITGVNSSGQEGIAADQHDGADTVAESEVSPQTRTHGGDGVHLKELLYYIAEEQSRLNGYVHRGVMCNGCYSKPIRGVRWRCANCADYDLCSECEAMGMHSKTHIFYKVKIPAPFLGNPRQAQPVVYPGIPERMPRGLPVALSKRLAEETNFDKEEVDALFDQFSCLANARWAKDPNEIGYAIDRIAFDTAFIPLTSINAPQPNLLYDRIFSFYDANGDGLIGFEELLKGLSYVQRKSRDERGRRRLIFNGFDIDDDGYISRRDVLRLFRAYYTIQKDITHDLIAVQEEEFDIKNVNSFINTTQPLSAIFTEPAPPPPPPTSFTVEEKPSNTYGDRRNGNNALFESSKDLASREEIIKESAGQPQAADDESYVSDSDSGSAKSSQDSDSLNSSREKITESQLRDRLKRRQFYTDEEEGWQPASTAQISNTEAESSLTQRTPLGLLRSASIWNPSEIPGEGLIETPASAIDNSPQVMRDNGYEVPIPGTEYGKEILYQVVQEGLNELLDPLFKEKEDLAIEVEATSQERSKWRGLIAESIKAMQDRRNARQNELSVTVDKTNSASEETDQLLEPPADVASPADEDDVDNTEVQNPQPSSSRSGSATSKACKESPRNTPTSHEYQQSRDPTMPQFRPNSDKELLSRELLKKPESTHPNGSLKSSIPAKRTSESTPSKSQVRRYAMLDEAEREIMDAGGPGRLSFKEFEELMDSAKGRKLVFVDSWFELGSF
jgi:Ca2+-binding EF-hand superfamily protein